MNEAIKIAIEKGGYRHNGHEIRWEPITKSWWFYWIAKDEEGDPYEASHPCCYDHPLYQNPLLLDPLFWQSLSKALGWPVNTRVALAKYPGVWEQASHRYYAHRWLDAHFEGTEEQFWKDLLQTNT